MLRRKGYVPHHCSISHDYLEARHHANAVQLAARQQTWLLLALTAGEQTSLDARGASIDGDDQFVLSGAHMDTPSWVRSAWASNTASPLLAMRARGLSARLDNTRRLGTGKIDQLLGEDVARFHVRYQQNVRIAGDF